MRPAARARVMIEQTGACDARVQQQHGENAWMAEPASIESDAQCEADERAQADRLLIQRIGAGDRQALTTLYTRYGQALLRYLLRLTPDHGLAEEIVQDTLLAVWRSAASYEGRSSPLTWLIGVARRQAHNTLRQRGLSLIEDKTLETITAPAVQADPAEIALANVARDELMAAINRLAPIHREALTLAFVHGLTYQEMAEALETPVGTIKSRLYHARQALRALLATVSDGSSDAITSAGKGDLTKEGR